MSISLSRDATIFLRRRRRRRKDAPKRSEGGAHKEQAKEKGRGTSFSQGDALIRRGKERRAPTFESPAEEEK